MDARTLRYTPGSPYSHGMNEWAALRRYAQQLQARALCERVLGRCYAFVIALLSIE